MHLGLSTRTWPVIPSEPLLPAVSDLLLHYDMAITYGPGSSNNFANIGAIALWCMGKNCFDVTQVIPDGYLSTATANACSSGTSKGALVETFKSGAYAYYYATAGPPSNKKALDDLTQQFGQDYIAWKCVSFDQVFNSILAIQQNGLLDETIWTWKGTGQSTRIYTYPPAPTFQELGHRDFYNDCNYTADPCHYFYGPPGACVASGATGTASGASSGQCLELTRYKLCLFDGRLMAYFVQEDDI